MPQHRNSHFSLLLYSHGGTGVGTTNRPNRSDGGFQTPERHRLPAISEIPQRLTVPLRSTVAVYDLASVWPYD